MANEYGKFAIYSDVLSRTISEMMIDIVGKPSDIDAKLLDIDPESPDIDAKLPDDAAE